MSRMKQPAAVLVANGSKMGRREMLERMDAEPVVPDMPWECPAYLTGTQVEEFWEVVSNLKEFNRINESKGGGLVWSGTDSEDVAQYIVNKDLAHVYQKQLEAAIAQGDLDAQKAVARLHMQYCELERKFANDIGYTVQSRLKIVLPGKADDGGEFGGL